MADRPLALDYLLTPDETETKTVTLAAAGLIKKCVKETGKPPVAIELTSHQAEVFVHQEHGLWVDVELVLERLEKSAIAAGLPRNQLGSIDGVPIVRQVSALPETAKETVEGLLKLRPQTPDPKCGHLGPFWGRHTCVLPKGHKGSHRAAGTDFPNGKLEWMSDNDILNEELARGPLFRTDGSGLHQFEAVYRCKLCGDVRAQPIQMPDEKCPGDEDEPLDIGEPANEHEALMRKAWAKKLYNWALEHPKPLSYYHPQSKET